MSNIRTITISAKEIITDTKKKFISCSAKIRDKWFKIKFTQDCNDTPKTKGLYRLTVDLNECSVERGKHYTNKSGKKGVENDTIWVRSVAGLAKYTEEELAERNLAEMNDIFGEE